MNVFIGEPVDMEFVEVDELPPPASGKPIVDPEYLYRWNEQAKQVFLAILKNQEFTPESPLGMLWGKAHILLYLLFDRTPKTRIQARINTLVKNAKGVTDSERLQALIDYVIGLLGETITPAKPDTPKVPRSPDPPELAINNKVSHGIGMAIAAGGPNARKKVKGWRDNVVNGHPVFPCDQGRDAMTVYLEPTGYNAQELWAKVHNLDALTLDVYLAVLMLVCDPKNKAAYPHFGWFAVNPAQIADMKAFRRYGNDRRVLIGKIVEALHTISDLRTDFVIRWPGQGKKEQNRMARETGCRLLHIGSVVYVEHGELFEHPQEFPKDKQAVAVNIFIGKWGTYWLRDGETYYWVAAASRKLLELDYRQTNMGEVFAKKIGMLLLTMEGGTRSQNETLVYTIAELLEEIRELLAEEFRGKRRRDTGEVEETREGEHWASRTEAYLQAGLTALRQDGLLASYNFSSDYPEPGDRGRGWVERWLSAKVYLTTPKAAALMEQLPQQTPIPAPERKRRIRGLGKVKKPLVRGQYLDAATVATIYNAYKARNWTQATLAKELKVARPTLSNVLNGREAPSPELAARIRAFLDSPIGA